MNATEPVKASALRYPVLAFVSVAALAAVLAGCGQARGQSEAVRSQASPLHAPANYDPSLPGFVACSRVIVEGDVISVIDASPGRMLTTPTVTDWVKPATGAQQAKIDTVDIAGEGVYKRWPPGTHLFLAVDVDPSALPNWEFTTETAAAIRKAVSPATTKTCPYGPQ